MFVNPPLRRRTFILEKILSRVLILNREITDDRIAFFLGFLYIFL